MINLSKRLFLPLIEQHVNLTYKPHNTYLFNNLSDDIFTLIYNYDENLIKTGYETFGFLKFDSYLCNHRFIEFIYDYNNEVAYGFKVPFELKDTFNNVKTSNLKNIYTDHRQHFNYNDFNLKISKTYETFYYDKKRILKFKTG